MIQSTVPQSIVVAVIAACGGSGEWSDGVSDANDVREPPSGTIDALPPKPDTARGDAQNPSDDAQNPSGDTSNPSGDAPKPIDCGTPERAGSPKGDSTVIECIRFDRSSWDTAADGSDLWPVTWAHDDNIYTSWGDGGGFGETGWGGPSRVGMGFARIENGPTNYIATNVNGGHMAKNLASFERDDAGKTGGMLAIDKTLYAWMNTQNQEWPNVDFALIWSEDLGATWERSSWTYRAGNHNYKPQQFLNYGKNYSGAPDDWVYTYGVEQGNRNQVFLARVHRSQLRVKAAYEYFSGTEDSPSWSADIEQRAAILTDPNGALVTGVAYNAGIGRYLLMTTRMGSKHPSTDRLAIFDAPSPWGPWTTVAYYSNWLDAGDGCSLVNQFADKWTSMNGREMWMVFSCHCGCNYHDSFNLVRADVVPY